MIKGLNWLSTLMELKVNSAKRAGACVACLSPNAINGLCTPCQDDLPMNRWSCRCCALPLPFAADGQLCGECLSEPPPYDYSVIPWRYQYPVDSMIGRYKYQHQRQFARPLIEGLSQRLAAGLDSGQLPRPDCLLPAPMHPSRRRKRGFNQAQDIAEQLGQQLNLPVATGLVRRSRKVRSQRELNRRERQANLKGVFELRALPARSVAIVDDVVTTGATAQALATLLMDAGTQQVQVWALARTPA